MKLKIYFILLGILLVVQPVFGQQPPHPDPIAQNTFPPALVMQNQQAADLGDEQKKAIKTQIRESEVKFQELRWNLEDEMETFISLLTSARVDEKKALAQLDKILNIESQIKKLIENLLKYNVSYYNISYFQLSIIIAERTVFDE